MPKRIEKPVTKPYKGPHDDDVETTHPAFGQIQVNRFQGRSVFYGSDFIHNCGMTIRIRRSKLMRELSHDWYFDTDNLIEVRLTEAQWATFVSSPNSGNGVPCTIEYIGREDIPGLPDPADRGIQFEGEAQSSINNCVKQVKDMLEAMDGMGLPKKKTEELRNSLNKIISTLTSTLPFVAKSFSEHVEKNVEKAKQEIEGYMLNSIKRAGLEALRGGKLPLKLNGKEDIIDEK